jgi:ubiquinone/menaquinone biosynthesis C-methylase UbiE
VKIEYEETSEDLQTRINIHEQFGGRDIDQWMLDLLKPEPNSRILDVGCGSGKQCLAFHDYLEGSCQVVGGDVSQELMAEARDKAKDAGEAIRIIDLDFNQSFPLETAEFDLVSCCFAIYYAEDIGSTLGEIHRVLKPGGRLFTTGPMPTNKQLFYDVIKQATDKPIPTMPGSSRYDSEILQSMKELFSEVDVHIFENPLTFPSVQPFVDYTRASLSEDRKIWADFFVEEGDFESIMEKIKQVAAARHAEEGELIMTKVVGGFIAIK